MKIHDFMRQKQLHKKITMVTCYDYTLAKLLDGTNIGAVLVGDSLAQVMHGLPSTVMATMDMMIMHTQAVARGLTQPFLITDLPFLCHRGSQSETIHNVKQLIQAGAEAVKIEGGDKHTCETIEYLVTSGIPVMGHIGLTAQYIHQLGGYKIQGKEEEQAYQLMEQAKALEASGCFSIVIECVPNNLAQRITQALNIPTIGIGAGHCTDGQVLVLHDLLGLNPEFKAKFVKHFAQGKNIMVEAINNYISQVQSLHYPAIEHTF